MLSRLSIADIVLIEKIELAFSPGLTIFTGETGAGKSIILDALSLALGARGDGALVRTGAASGQVTAVFEDAEGVLRARLEDAGVPHEGEIVIRRQQFADGRTRAFINDTVVTVQTLKSLAADLVEIHGQHDDRALLDAAEHRALVDAYSGAHEAVAATRAAFQTLQATRRDLEAEAAALEARRADADYARHAMAEIAKIAPKPGEERALADRRQAMLQGEKVAKDLHEAGEALSGEGAVIATMSSLSRKLERRLAQAPELMEPSVKAVSEALNAVELAADALESALRASAFDPNELERCEERLFALRAMARKYAVDVDQLPTLAEKFAAQVSQSERAQSRVEELTKALSDHRAVYDLAAKALTHERVGAARRLEAAVMAEMPALKLDQGRFFAVVETDPERVAAEGRERIAFEVQTNPGSSRGDLAKIASGGELSRFLLALKVALTEKTGAPTIIFDEIDSGVGGAVADAIGQRLARLSGRAQVLAVTHAPQVAARADHHMKITKTTDEAAARSITAVAPLDKAARQEEIARMLAGAEITKAARAAARSLLGT